MVPKNQHHQTYFLWRRVKCISYSLYVEASQLVLKFISLCMIDKRQVSWELTNSQPVALIFNPDNKTESINKSVQSWFRHV